MIYELEKWRLHKKKFENFIPIPEKFPLKFFFQKIFIGSKVAP